MTTPLAELEAECRRLRDIVEKVTRNPHAMMALARVHMGDRTGISLWGGDLFDSPTVADAALEALAVPTMLEE